MRSAAHAPTTRPRAQGRCSECKQWPEEGTKLRHGVCKRCREKDLAPRACSVCEKLPAPGERLWGGVCKGCRATAKAGSLLGAAGGAPVSDAHSDEARQVASPVIVSFELEQLRRRVAGVERTNAHLRQRLSRIQVHVAGMLRRYESFAAELKRDLDETEPQP